MTKSKKEENSENKDETSVTNEESAAEISNTEEQEEKKGESSTEETDTTSNDKSEDKSEESQEDELEKTEVKETEIKDSPESSPNVSDESDTDSPDNPKINGISEKLISLETESEKGSDKEESDDDVQHINKTNIIPKIDNIIPKIDNIKINTVETVSAENSFSISLNNDDLEKSNLSIFEKKIIQKIFVKSIESVREVIDNPNIESVIAITIIITNIAQLLEHVKINSVSHSGKISGNMKKNIVLFLGRLIIEKNMSFTEKDNILALYDIYADSVLERIIKFAKNNKVPNMVEQKYDESVSHLKNKTKNCCIIS